MCVVPPSGRRGIVDGAVNLPLNHLSEEPHNSMNSGGPDRRHVRRRISLIDCDEHSRTARFPAHFQCCRRYECLDERKADSDRLRILPRAVTWFKRETVIVRGRVQGVGFRWFVQRTSERLGVRGYVRNLPGGEVEVQAEAEQTILDALKQELQRGPVAARVSEVIEQDLQVTNSYESFLIR